MELNFIMPFYLQGLATYIHKSTRNIQCSLLKRYDSDFKETFTSDLTSHISTECSKHSV